MRQETKFLGSYQQLRKFISTKKIERHHESRIVNSIYYDNKDFESFIDSEEGLVPRRKYRLRWYGDTFIDRNKINGQFEIKSTLDTFRKKELHQIKKMKEIDFFDYIKKLNPKMNSLIPVVSVHYEREYFINSDGVRFTLDSKIKFKRITKNHESFLIKIFNNSILEVKNDISIDIDIVAKNFYHRRVRNSKYCEAVRSFFEDLYVPY